ncbi:hypothetical protein [Bradyrhizobium sp. NP1]|uniref:hypothetical protein n=1 Tax=Bradyrhizobium sp. NP1 TaxID=3049772 RepID=UPI0025A51CA0|nr:hypothetical protein [Bradyrhizobium sp. NP1]WJR76507.1 hypothetical protein QOU61_27640 [Bradyrhizobium sp. NP1]
MIVFRSSLLSLLVAGMISISVVAVAEPAACDVAGDSQGLFYVRPKTGPNLSSRIFAEPKKSSFDLRSRFLNEIILGRVLTEKLSSSDRNCSFDPDIEPNSIMVLDSDSLNVTVDECLLAHCARLASNILKADPVDELEFHNIVDSIVRGKTVEYLAADISVARSTAGNRGGLSRALREWNAREAHPQFERR